MMSYIFGGLITLSVVFGVLTGRMQAVSTAVLEESANAVALLIKLAGMMCFWSGMMEIAKKAQLTQKLSACFRPVFRLLFRELHPNSKAANAIVMNLAANLLGLGNAATPFGIIVMKELSALSSEKTTATNAMAMFVVLNTASLQLVPTTVAALRLANGSAAPMEILPAVWLSSGVSVLAGVLMCIFLCKKI